MGDKRTLEAAAVLPVGEISRLFDAGTTPNPNDLVDWEFRGFNLPIITRIAGFQKFRKGFYRHGDEIWGYNVPVEQGALSKPWTCKPSHEDPKRFGFYKVTVVGESDQRAKVSPALLLDYSQGKNGLFEGSFLRDYVRRADSGNDDLFIGKAYTCVASAQILPTFFIIERDRKAPTPVAHRG